MSPIFILFFFSLYLSLVRCSISRTEIPAQLLLNTIIFYPLSINLFRIWIEWAESFNYLCIYPRCAAHCFSSFICWRRRGQSTISNNKPTQRRRMNENGADRDTQASATPTSRFIDESQNSIRNSLVAIHGVLIQFVDSKRCLHCSAHIEIQQDVDDDDNGEWKKIYLNPNWTWTL